MKTRIVAIALVLLAQAWSVSVRAEEPRTEIAARDRASIVFIASEYFDKNTNMTQPGPTGSGFIVSDEGYVLTATHLIQDWLGQTEEDRKKFRLVGKIGTRTATESILLRFVAADSVGDYALLRLTDSSKKYQPVQLCFDSPPLMKTGDTIYALALLWQIMGREVDRPGAVGTSP